MTQRVRVGFTEEMTFGLGLGGRTSCLGGKEGDCSRDNICAQVQGSGKSQLKYRPERREVEAEGTKENASRKASLGPITGGWSLGLTPKSPDTNSLVSTASALCLEQGQDQLREGKWDIS